MGNETWMRLIKPNTSLYKIIIPGSHDSGMGDVTGLRGVLHKRAVRTQDLTIKKQLMAGTRFFDLRVYDALTTKELFTGHFVEPGRGKKFIGGYGESLKDVLQSVRDFIKGGHGESETVIMRFSHVKKGMPEKVVPIIRSILAGTGGQTSVLYAGGGNYPLANVQMQHLRGKVVVVCEDRYANAIRNHGDLYLFDRIDQWGTGTNGVLSLWGKYAKTTDFQKMMKDQLDKLKKRKSARTTRGPNGHLSMLYWTLTPNINRWNIKKLAKEAMKNPDFHLFNKTVKVYKPNIVLYDFVNEDINTKLIKLNQPIMNVGRKFLF